MRHYGFTLLELSIVLVIIGLVVGGVMAGQELIRQSQLQRAGKQLMEIATAVNTFKLKYNAIPGDFNKASQFWPTDCVDQATPANTCNGNGDGHIQSSGNGVIANSPALEQIRSFQHMSLSGILPGTYTGIAPSTTRIEEAGVTTVAGIIPGSAISLNTAVTSPVYGKNLAKIGISLGMNQGCNQFNNHGLLTSAEAKSIDDKFDDGMPDNGVFFTTKGRPLSTCATFLPGCVTNDNTATSTAYDLSSTLPHCRIVHWFN
jgi:prepilin-type N-terminal cleavage/methylation domain-containing protein